MEIVKKLVTNKFIEAQHSLLGVQRLERFLVKHHLLASKSFAEYKSRNISKKRLRIGWIINAFIIIFTIRYAILCVYSPQWLLQVIGEFNQALAPIELISGVYVCGGIIASFRQFLNLYFEQKCEFKAIDVLYRLSTRDPTHSN